MGIRAWARRRKLRNACKLVEREVFQGKAIEDLERQGGWETLGRGSIWRTASQIWETFTDEEKERAFRTAAIIYACVKRRADAAADAFLEVGKWTGKRNEEWDPYAEHPFYELMHRPNPSMDKRQYMWEYLAHKDLTGFSYVWKLRNRAGEVAGLRPLPTSCVRRRVANGRVVNYAVARTAQQVWYVPPDDMMIGKYPDPHDPDRATSPMDAALKDYQIDDARQALMIEILTNMHFPGTIFSREGKPWTGPQMEKMRQKFRDIVGPGKRGDAMFLSGEGKTDVRIPEPPKDLDWPGTASLAETRICACFGVPPILLGLRSGLERSTFSNTEEARRSFYQDTMRIVWKQIASEHEKALLLDEGNREDEIEPDYTGIPEMNEKPEELHSRVRNDYRAGMITLNEARKDTGREEVDGGDARLLLMTLMDVPIGEAAGGTQEPPGGTEPPEDDVEKPELEAE